jgi:hypothetical protein
LPVGVLDFCRHSALAPTRRGRFVFLPLRWYLRFAFTLQALPGGILGFALASAIR